MESLNKKQKIILIGICVIMLFVIGYYIMQKAGNYEGTNLNEYIQGEEREVIENDFTSERLEENIIVYITGEVKNGGIVEVEEGARISDVVEKAGGLTKEANLTNVNLAYKVQDGEKIYIPSIKDKEEKEVVSSGNGENIITGGNSNYINGKININTAGQAELETLQGIGPSTAMKIIEYRNNNGKFKKIEDIMDVPGIGEAKFQAIKENISVF